MFCKKCGNNLPDNIKFCGKCGTPTDGSVVQSISGSQLVLPAPILRRLSNHVIDLVVSYIMLMAFILLSTYLKAPALAVLGYIIYLVGYYFICEAIWGKTLGKLITKTKVVDRDGRKPSPLRIFGRSCARWIPFNELSFLVGSFPVGWHDSLSKTFVVSDSLSVEDIKKIDIVEIRKQNSNNMVLVVVLIIVGGLFLIAILGVISSVVLASLNSARVKASDSLIRANMSSLRAEAELYAASNGNSYLGLCHDNKTLDLLKSASKSATGGQSETNYICNDDESDYAASMPLKSAGYFCVDNSGKLTTINIALTAQTSCSGLPTVSPTNNQEFIKQAVDYAKKTMTLPSKIDNATTLTDITAEPGAILYHYTLSGIDTSKLTNEYLKSYLLLNVCKNNSAKELLDKGIDLQHSYIDNVTQKSFFISVKEKDCL